MSTQKEITPLPKPKAFLSLFEFDGDAQRGEIYAIVMIGTMPGSKVWDSLIVGRTKIVVGRAARGEE